MFSRKTVRAVTERLIISVSERFYGEHPWQVPFQFTLRGAFFNLPILRRRRGAILIFLMLWYNLEIRLGSAGNRSKEGDEMKKIFSILLIAGLMTCIPGCGGGAGSSSELTDSAEAITKAVDQLSGAKSYELKTYNEEETVFGDKKTAKEAETITKAIFEPFTQWSKTEGSMTRIDGQKSRSDHETYQTLKDDKLTLYVRFYQQNGQDTGKDADPGGWEKASEVTDKAQIDSMMRYNKNWIMTEIQLLRANISSFQPVADTDAESKGLMKYEGSIDPKTVLEAYRKYLRESYIEMKFIQGNKNPSAEDLKNEITGGRPEFQVGPTKLAFSDEPVPVTLWIDKDSLALKKVVLDETSVLQALTEKALQESQVDYGDPVVKKATVTYEITSINEFDRIPAPESLKKAN